VDHIDTLELNPRPSECRKLVSARTALYRIRVGDYRVVYEVDDRAVTVLIVRIAHRSAAYGR